MYVSGKTPDAQPDPYENMAPGQREELLARNAAIDRLLDPLGSLPTADVYPVLGSIFYKEDLAKKYPPGTLLPVQEALEKGEFLTVALGREGRVVGEFLLNIRPDMGERLLHGMDADVPADLLGTGLGKTLMIATLKSFPLGFEMTYSGVTAGGRRIANWLADSTVMVKRRGYGDGKPGEYMTQLNSLY
jgi:hypothetical protein